MYSVYWIRLQEHTDKLTEGYIGITKNLKERVKSHKNKKGNLKITNAIKKYGFDNLIIDVLHEEKTLEEALQIEKEMRPKPNIGWNHQTGGEIGVDSSWYDVPENRDRHSKITSVRTKEAIKEKDSYHKRSQRAKLSRQMNAESYLDINKGSKNSRAILNEDQVRDIKSMFSTKSNRELADLYGVKINVIQQIKSGKNWSHI